MKVYIVFWTWYYEYSEVRGVYETREKAEEYIRNNPTDPNYSELEILEWEVK